MRKFRVGDKVRILKHEAFKSSGIFEYMYGKSVGLVGVITKISGSTLTPYILHDSLDEEPGGYFGFYAEDELELMGGTMKVGDTLVDGDGDEAKILAYMNQGVEVYLMSQWSDVDAAAGWCTTTDIASNGWKLKDDPQVEKSVADIEKELKLAPGMLRIKREDA